MLKTNPQVLFPLWVGMLLTLVLGGCGSTRPQRVGEQPSLISDRGVDYGRLQVLLAAEDWQAADEETLGTLLMAMGKEQVVALAPLDFMAVPCTDLRTLDHLWRYYSEGRFGFTLQKINYIRAGGRLNAETPPSPSRHTIRQFTERQGWLNRQQQQYLSYPDINYSAINVIQPQVGYLPFTWWGAGIRDHFLTGGGGRLVEINPDFAAHLFSRMEACDL